MNPELPVYLHVIELGASGADPLPIGRGIVLRVCGGEPFKCIRFTEGSAKICICIVTTHEQITYFDVDARNFSS